MITEKQKSIIKELQEDLPLIEKPFEAMAKRLNLNEEELIAEISLLKENGYLRRFGAALSHRQVGYNANAMIVWQVPEDKSEEVGKKIADFPEVTHCYHRQASPKWSHNIFAMIHFSRHEECYEMAETITDAIGNYPYKLLFSTKEFKKTSMTYFMD